MTGTKWKSTALPDYMLKIIDAFVKLDEYPMGRYNSTSNYTLLAVAKMIKEDAERFKRTIPDKYNKTTIYMDGEEVKVDDFLEKLPTPGISLITDLDKKEQTS